MRTGYQLALVLGPFAAVVAFGAMLNFYFIEKAEEEQAQRAAVDPEYAKARQEAQAEAQRLGSMSYEDQQYDRGYRGERCGTKVYHGTSLDCLEGKIDRLTELTSRNS